MKSAPGFTRSSPLGYAALAALLVVACGGDPPPADAGVDAASDASVAPGVAPPAIPWLTTAESPTPPVGIAPCPAGWREVTDATGLVTCDPYPSEGALACTFGEAHFPGETGCVPVGDPCPAGSFAPGLPTDGSVVYIDASTAAGGDGTLAAPYASLGDVSWSTLAPGTTVALAKGMYAGTLALKAGTRVVGACAAETILTGDAAPVGAVITVTSAGEPAVVRNLSIRGSPQAGVRVDSGRSLALEGVAVVGATQVGLQVEGAGSLLRATSVLVDDTQPDTGIGWGVDAEAGGRFEGARIVVAQTQGIGIVGSASPTTVTLRDAAVLGTEASAAGILGNGVQISYGASLDAERVVLSRNRNIALQLLGAETQGRLTDAVVRDTREQAIDQASGLGLTAQDGARVEVTRTLFAHNRGGAAYVALGAWVSLTDVVVRETLSDARGGQFGRGIDVEQGGTLDANRVVIADNRDVGVFAADPATSVTLTDVVVRDTLSEERGRTGGRGIGVQAGAQLGATRVLVVRSRELGVYANGGGTSLTLADVVVRSTLPRESDLVGGHGIGIEVGAALFAERIRIEDTSEMGLVALVDASIEAHDIVVQRVAPSLCDCPERGFGFGVTASERATVRLSSFEVSDAALCGLLVNGDASTGLDAEHGVVQRAAIGACLQADGYDITRVQLDVRYSDNGSNLEATTLPVPAPFGADEP